MYEELEENGLKPVLNVIDSECSKAVQDYITSHYVKYQLDEPDNHHANAAERSIETF